MYININIQTKYGIDGFVIDPQLVIKEALFNIYQINYDHIYSYVKQVQIDTNLTFNQAQIKNGEYLRI